MVSQLFTTINAVLVTQFFRLPLTSSAIELRDHCAIVGAGHSRLGRLPEISVIDLQLEAIKNAVEDAGLTMRQIDGVICAGPHQIYSFHQVIGARLGINARFFDRA